MGGTAGGKARAESLSGEDRSAIARKAAAARWKDKPKKEMAPNREGDHQEESKKTVNVVTVATAVRWGERNDEKENWPMAEPARQRVNEQNAEPAQLELVAAPATPPLQRERDPEQLHLSLLRVVESVRETVQAIHASQRAITEELRGIKTSLPMQRRPLSRRTQSIHLHATLTRRNGLCLAVRKRPYARIPAACRVPNTITSSRATRIASAKPGLYAPRAMPA